ncbi:MAG: DegT/DnrJ/EryC1/StrS family aminotransferase [Bryobacteraceae bacterium]
MQTLALFGGQPLRRDPFAAWPVFDDTERSGVMEVLESGSWGGYNPKVKEFESRFAAAHGAKYGISACNGTLTLESALLAAGVQPRDEVIVPPVTFVATATAVLRVQAVPVFADIEPSTCNLNPDRAEAAITPLTKAIIPVHFAGHPADMDALCGIARKHNLTIIEDCAHAHGAEWRGQKVGTFGEFGSFSFQQSKNMTAGEGGMLITNRPDLAERAWAFANQGRSPGGAWYEHDSLGTNLRLTGFQAAILLAQLVRLPDQLGRRARNADYLTARLLESGFLLPPAIDERVTRHGLYLYLLRLNRKLLPDVSKDQFVRALTAEGIPGASSYPYPLYRNKLFNSHAYSATDCLEAERACADTFWLSHEVLLAECSDLDDVVRAVEKVGSFAADLSASITDFCRPL